MDIFRGSSKNCTGLKGSFLCILWYFFFRSMNRMGIFFGVAKFSNIFGGMPDFSDFFFL